MSEKFAVLNINHPGSTSNVDSAKYHDVKKALLHCLPKQSPGLTQTEMFKAVQPYLNQELFPEGAKSGWWVKTVQLDLEARGVMQREKTKPLTWIKL